MLAVHIGAANNPKVATHEVLTSLAAWKAQPPKKYFRWEILLVTTKDPSDMEAFCSDTRLQDHETRQV
jgi:hypothetical protein